jgi:cation transport ATPase
VSTTSVDNKSTDRRLLQLDAAAEESSGHPMAVAILDKVRRSGWSENIENWSAGLDIFWYNGNRVVSEKLYDDVIMSRSIVDEY